LTRRLSIDREDPPCLAQRFGPSFALQRFVIAPSTLPALQWSGSSVENHGKPFAAHDASADQTPSSFQNIFAATLTPGISAQAPRQATPEHWRPERSTPQTAKTQPTESAQRPASASAGYPSARPALSESKPSAPTTKSRAESQSNAHPNGADQGAAPLSGANPADSKQSVTDSSQAQAQPQTLPLPANPPLPLAVAATAAPSQPDRPAASAGNPNPPAIVSLPPGGAIPAPAFSGVALGSTDIAFALQITPDGGANQSAPSAGQPQTAVAPNAKPANSVPSQPSAAAPLNAKQTASSAAAPNTTPAGAVSAAVGSGGAPPRSRSAASAAASPGGPNLDGKPDGNPAAHPIIDPVINAVIHSNLAGNPTPWAAPTLDTANSGTSRVESTVAAAPVSAIAPDSSEAAAQPMRSVRVQLAGEGDQRVDMRLVEYAGGLSVSVRTSDNSLTRGLQDHLPELGARLAAEHYQSQAWLPSVSEASAGKSAASSSGQSGEQPAGRGGGQAFSQGGSSSSGGDRPQQQQGRNPDRAEAWWERQAAFRPVSTRAAAEQQSSVASPLGIPTANSN
jgi:hypothetical protein